MANGCTSNNTGKQVIISLRGYSHEVCVAATQTDYWQQLIKTSSISITSNGKYIPIEFKSICNEEDEPRLQLIIQSQHEKDNKQVDIVCNKIRSDLISFKTNDVSIYDADNRQLLVFGSLFNSLPSNEFNFERNLLGQQNCNIIKIENTFGCSIVVDKLIPERYRFTIRHEELIIMDLAAIQIQALVRQAQNQYIIAFATKIGHSLSSPIEQLETSISSSSSSLNPHTFPSFKSFKSISKRKREEDEEQQLTTIDQPIMNSGRSEDEAIPDEKRYKTGDF